MNRAQRRAAARLRTKPQRRHADPSAAHTLLTIHRPFSADEAAHIAIGARLAWHKLTTGAGTESEFDILATAANVALIRAESIDAIAVEVVQRAQAALVRMQERYRRIGKFGPDADALATVPEFLDLYDQIVRLSTPRQLVDAVNAAMRRIHDGAILNSLEQKD